VAADTPNRFVVAVLLKVLSNIQPVAIYADLFVGPDLPCPLTDPKW
jgi:hypothetical protein